MSKYRKKPVVIDAFQWTGGPDQTEDPQWCVDAIIKGDVELHLPGFSEEGEPYLIIKTLEGDHKANVGDYIIKGVKGEIYPCKPDIFEMTYDPFKINIPPIRILE